MPWRAVLGANFDDRVAARGRKIICNVGNFHALVFRLGEKGIEGVFEHHTGEIDLPKLEGLIRKLTEAVQRSMRGGRGRGVAPWDAG